MILFSGIIKKEKSDLATKLVNFLINNDSTLFDTSKSSQSKRLGISDVEYIIIKNKNSEKFIENFLNDFTKIYDGKSFYRERNKNNYISLAYKNSIELFESDKRKITLYSSILNVKKINKEIEDFFNKNIPASELDEKTIMELTKDCNTLYGKLDSISFFIAEKFKLNEYDITVNSDKNLCHFTFAYEK